MFTQFFWNLLKILKLIIRHTSYIYGLFSELTFSLRTCVLNILLWAPGEWREAQEAGEVSLRPLVNLRLLLRGGAGMVSPAGWKNPSGRWKRGEMPLAPPCPSLLSLLLLLDTPPWGGNTFFLLLSWCQYMYYVYCFNVYTVDLYCRGGVYIYRATVIW